MKAYLIDPERRSVEVIALNPKDILGSIYALIGSDDLDHGTLSDMHDSIWLYGRGLLDGKPIHAFKLPVQREPYAGRAVVIGADARGETAPPHIPVEIIKRDIEWLGVIVPRVDWIEQSNGIAAVVTYSRPQHP